MSNLRKPTLESNDAQGVAAYLSSGKCKKVMFMIGAGISTSAGIPDFRSPKTGLYANLARLKLPHPEAVFEIRFFKSNPVPFYTLAQELYPGKFRPTISHSFIKLLAEHSLLHTCFTQNIDTLERRANVPAEKIIEAHGSFATQRCVRCKRPYDDEKMKKKVLKCEVPRCENCKDLVKPDIVFFGEGLPVAFSRAVPAMTEADLLIIIGTSLTVHPFASIAELVPAACPRVLINLDRVGGIGRRQNDVVLLGKCDEIIRNICRAAGWLEELETLWDKTKESVEGYKPEETPSTTDDAKDTENKKPVVAPRDAEEEVEKLTAAIETKLDIKEEKQPGPLGPEDTTAYEISASRDSRVSTKEDKDEPTVPFATEPDTPKSPETEGKL